MIEVEGWLPSQVQSLDTAVIACALKCNKVQLILITIPPGTTKQTAESYQILKTLHTNKKPTCLIQLSKRHLAVAVGSLKENSAIEIHDINTSIIVSRLEYHTDMIDSMMKYQFPLKIYRTDCAHV